MRAESILQQVVFVRRHIEESITDSSPRTTDPRMVASSLNAIAL